MTEQILKSRIAVVTGGGSGIGAGCAAALARNGADVALLVHENDAASERVRADVVRAGRRAVTAELDVGREDDVARAFDQVAGELGVPDILVNAAGLNMSGTPVADLELDAWEKLLRTDLTGSFLTSRRFVRDLRDIGQPGSIVNITSIHAFAMRAGGADYASAKGGQANLTRTVALECAAMGITVNAIAPGMILTPMNDDAMEDAAKRAEKERNIPLKRAGTVEEVARLCAFLVSPDAAYITGTSVTIDGGLSLLMGQGA